MTAINKELLKNSLNIKSDDTDGNRRFIDKALLCRIIDDQPEVPIADIDIDQAKQLLLDESFWLEKSSTRDEFGQMVPLLSVMNILFPGSDRLPVS